MKTNNKNNSQKTNTKSNLELAMKITKETLVKRTSTRKSMNQYLLETLKGRKVERLNIVTEITLKRMEDGGNKVDFQNQEFVDKFTKLLRTVKNGVDTSISNSQNNSSFSFNPEFKQFELKEVEPKVYTIVDRK